MDPKTQKYYSDHSEELFERYSGVTGGIVDKLGDVFKPGMEVLDIGSGSGRDVARMLEGGVDAFGLEPCEEFVNLGEKTLPELKGRIYKGSIPDNLGELGDKKFDGILCSSMLMHIPDDRLFDSVFVIRNLLKDEGILVLSIPAKRNDVTEEGRDATERLMILRSSNEYQLMFERAGFRLMDSIENDDALGREGIRWVTLIFTYHSDQVQRPIDKIESILNRDKKDATYKLALFRALCDIAQMEYRHAKWEGDNRVSVPLDLVAEKWIGYYWPLIGSDNFIPQKFGEKPGEGKKLIFRNALKELSDQFNNTGGFQGFFSNMKSGLGYTELKMYKKAVTKVKTAITKGPVIYAGGSLSSGRVFNYNKDTKRIIFSADIWKELVLMGHWIHDSLILRWAELTSSFTRGEINPSEIINLLLTKNNNRDVLEARRVYNSLREKECVWSGASLRENLFEVDHAIPFSLWKNNELWNLFPASSRVNNSKRDKLPSSNLIRKRKDLIIYYWEQIKEANEKRFINEMQRFTNMKRSDLLNWQKILFSTFNESIEYTATQRGWQRWNGL